MKTNSIIGARESCKAAISELLYNRTDGEIRKKATEALIHVNTLSKGDFVTLIDPVQDWRIKLMLMEFWLMVNERR